MGRILKTTYEELDEDLKRSVEGMKEEVDL